MNIQEISSFIEVLENNGIPYALGGSGMLYYYGLVDNINDWDLTVECEKERLLQIISPFEYNELRSGDFPFASQYRISVPRFPIDLIGSFTLHTGSGMVKLPIRPGADWEGVRISSLEVWYVAYKIMGRESKADLILKFLGSNPQSVNGELIHELLAMPALTGELREELIRLIR